MRPYGVGTNRSITASGSLIETGSSRQSISPACRQTFSCGFDRQSAVQPTMGTCSAWDSLRNSRASSKPSMSGKRKSNRISLWISADCDFDRCSPRAGCEAYVVKTFSASALGPKLECGQMGKLLRKRAPGFHSSA